MDTTTKRCIKKQTKKKKNCTCVIILFKSSLTFVDINPLQSVHRPTKEMNASLLCLIIVKIQFPYNKQTIRLTKWKHTNEPHLRSKQFRSGGRPCTSRCAAFPCPVSKNTACHWNLLLLQRVNLRRHTRPLTVSTCLRTVPSAKNSGFLVSTTIRSKNERQESFWLPGCERN